MGPRKQRAGGRSLGAWSSIRARGGRAGCARPLCSSPARAPPISPHPLAPSSQLQAPSSKLIAPDFMSSSSSPAPHSQVCENCLFWFKNKTGEALRAAAGGECRRRAAGDFRWPRTRAEDWCGEWSSKLQADSSQPQAHSPKLTADSSTITANLSLDMESGDAPPSASACADAGADCGTGNRQRRRASGGQAHPGRVERATLKS